MKKVNFLQLIWSLALVFLALGATFSFFTSNVRSSEGAVRTASAVVGIDLFVNPKFVGKELIPMYDTDLDKAYSQECIDDNNYGACQAYDIHIVNRGERLEYAGSVTFSINEITNLNYKILDSDGNTYVGNTRITTDTPLTLGPSFILDEGATKDFVMLIWLTNYDRDQNEEDLAGTYGASITYEALNGTIITGSIAGS